MAEDNNLKSDDQPNAASIFNQSGQTNYGTQTNVAGDYHDNRVTKTGGLDPAVLEKLFAPLNQEIEKIDDADDKAYAKKSVNGLMEEAQKGDKADEGNVEKWFNKLLKIAPDAWDVAVATFVNPVAGVGMAFKKIAEHAKSGQNNKSNSEG